MAVSGMSVKACCTDVRAGWGRILLLGSKAAPVGMLDTAPHTKVGSCIGRTLVPPPPWPTSPGPWSALGTWAKVPARVEWSPAVADAAASVLEDNEALAAAAAALIGLALIVAAVAPVVVAAAEDVDAAGSPYRCTSAGHSSRSSARCGSVATKYASCDFICTSKGGNQVAGSSPRCFSLCLRNSCGDCLSNRLKRKQSVKDWGPEACPLAVSVAASAAPAVTPE